MEEKIIRWVAIHDSHGNVVDEAPIYPQGTEELVSQHNADQEAHPYIKEAITGLRTQVERRLVGAKVTFNDGHTEDVELGFNDQGDVILLLPKETFGKIDGVKVNGEELEVDENGKVDINFSATVDGTYSDTPTVTPTIGEDGIQLDFQGIRGNGIASSTEVLSSEDGGLNTHTFVDNAGNEHVFHTINGKQGRPGADRQPVESGDVIIAHTTGQDEGKVMSQKAVTESIVSYPKTIVLDGADTDNSTCNLTLAKGRTYRLKLDKTSWSHTSQNYAIFSIGKYVGGNWVSLFVVPSTGTPQESYLFTVGNDTVDYTVNFRGNEGVQLYVTIEEVDSLATLSSSYCVGSGNEDAKTLNNGSGFRHYIYINKELPSPCRMKLIGELPTGVLFIMEGFTSLANVKSIAASSVESTTYDSGIREYDFAKCTYLRAAFKASSGNLTSAQMAAIDANSIIEIIPLSLDNAKEVVMQQDGVTVYPKVTSQGVVHGQTTLKDYLDMAVFYKEFNMSDMVASNPINSRRRYTTKVPQTPFYAKAEGSIPNGFVCYVGTNYTISDAKNPNVSHVQSTGWGVLSGYFDAENAYYVTIGWKKSNNGDFSAEDIAALEASNIKLVVRNFSLGADESTDIISLNDESRTLTYLRNAKRPQYKGSSYTPTITPCTLLHFSDIHADEQNMKRIVEFYNYYKSYIDDALCTGDIIKNLFSDSFAFWENAEAGSILNCAGNHEYYNGESTAPYYQQITQKQVYDKFFAPYIEQWGVTQPVDAEENGLNYYYKDYVTSNVRLIVLDNMRVDAAQLTWFEGVLADAITNGLHVVAAMHIGNPVGTITYDNPFNSLRENNPSSLNGWIHEDSELLYDKVDEFIGNNGVFVGWLMGHRHFDTIGTPHDHPNQLEIHVATGSCGSSWDIIPKGDNCDRTPGSKSQDCFNIYSIDTYYKMIRIHRIGSDVDRDFRHIGNLCYDYLNHRVIYCD